MRMTRDPFERFAPDLRRKPAETARSVDTSQGGENSRTVEILRCGNCGGTFHEGDAACPWCNAGIALEDRGRSHVCAQCAVRAPAGASWCPRCGERLGEQALAPRAIEAACPACRGELRERDVGAHRLTECAACGGLWLAPGVFDELCTAAERAGIAASSTTDRAPQSLAADARERVVYRPCPACGEVMNRRNHGGSSGVVVDVCRHHGVWLDAQELERVLAWVRGGGAERERQRRVDRARRSNPAAAPMLPLPLETRTSGGGIDLLEAVAWLLKRFR